jgi:hypothetical protein
MGDGCPINATQSCATVLQSFVSKNFSKMYYVLFAAVSFQLLAMSNAITMVCAGTDDDTLHYSDTDKEKLLSK